MALVSSQRSEHQIMCGRYVSLDDAAIEREFNLVHFESTFPPSYNVARPNKCPSSASSTASGAGTGSDGVSFCSLQDEPVKYSTINARIEIVETAASYPGPWKRGQRCLQDATGFFEWHTDDAGRKAAHYIHLVDQAVFAFAGLWDCSIKADGTAVESVVHITMPGNDLMRHVHNAGSNPYRTSASLKREDQAAWLTGSLYDARAVLLPYDQGLMVHYEVTTAVNRRRTIRPSMLSQ